MIKLEHVSFTYDSGQEPALKEVSLRIGRGEYVGIIGSNGCGKTTLLRHLNGLLIPDIGSVWVDGLNTGESRALKKIRQKVGIVFQNPDNQIVGMTVEEDLAFGPGNMGLSPEEIRKRVQNTLQALDMERQAKRAPHTLSGGEKRLLTLAGVLVMNPSCIAFDEPTCYLDPLERKRVLAVIQDLHKQGITVIHVTHHADEITCATQLVVMHRGEILLEGKPAEIFTKRLEGVGFDIPAITEFVRRLREMGANIRPNIITIDEACLELGPMIMRGL
jgi:biotin transport system ATP-binding protein